MSYEKKKKKYPHCEGSYNVSLSIFGTIDSVPIKEVSLLQKYKVLVFVARQLCTCMYCYC